MFVDDLRILEESLRYVRDEKRNLPVPSSLRRDSGGRIDANDLFKMMGTSPVAPDLFIDLPQGRDETVHQLLETDDPQSENDVVDSDVRHSGRSGKGRALSFSRAPIFPLELSHKPLLSGISVALSETSRGGGSKSTRGGSANSVTIYLPNGDTLDIAVNPSMKVIDIIKKVLAVHRSENILPPLSPHPDVYQLRIHDMDGEPDEDFPPLDPSRHLDSYGVQLSEYCLCQTGGHVHESTEALSTDESKAEPASVEIRIKFDDHDGVFKVKVKETALLHDLLPLSRTIIRLSLHTEQYVFTVSEEEQARLMLSSPVMDMNWSLSWLGVKEFRIKKKVFADVPTVTLPQRVERTESENVSKTKEIAAEGLFAYQEWPVQLVQKVPLNRTRKMDLTLAVDRSGFATFKAEAKRSVAPIVTKKVLSTLSSIEAIQGDPKSFRVIWRTAGSTEVGVYECINGAKDCEAIVTKVKGLVSLL